MRMFVTIVGSTEERTRAATSIPETIPLAFAMNFAVASVVEGIQTTDVMSPEPTSSWIADLIASAISMSCNADWSSAELTVLYRIR